jgi:hypothetical protein
LIVFPNNKEKAGGKMQLELGMLGRLDGAAAVPQSAVERIESYRDAVRMCWVARRSKGMTRNTLAELAGLYPQHVTDYLAESDTDRQGKPRRDLPAKYIKEFEAVTGNTFVSQWLAHQSGLTVLESVIADRKAA